MAPTPGPRRTAVAVALGALLLTGCADDGSTTAAPTTEPATPQPTAARPTATAPPSAAPPSPTPAWATCTVERAALRVHYPADWVARDHPSGGGCAYFDPEPFRVEPGTEATGMAVRLDVERVPYATVRDAYTRGEVLDSRPVQVAGHEGLRVEDVDTGGPTAPKGRRLTWLADLGQDRTLVLTTNETDADDPARAREVLDLMAQRLERA